MNATSAPPSLSPPLSHTLSITLLPLQIIFRHADVERLRLNSSRLAANGRYLNPHILQSNLLFFFSVFLQIRHVLGIRFNLLIYLFYSLVPISKFQIFIVVRHFSQRPRPLGAWHHKFLIYSHSSGTRFLLSSFSAFLRLFCERVGRKTSC